MNAILFLEGSIGEPSGTSLRKTLLSLQRPKTFSNMPPNIQAIKRHRQLLLKRLQKVFHRTCVLVNQEYQSVLSELELELQCCPMSSVISLQESWPQQTSRKPKFCLSTLRVALWPRFPLTFLTLWMKFQFHSKIFWRWNFNDHDLLTLKIVPTTLRWIPSALPCLKNSRS